MDSEKKWVDLSPEEKREELDLIKEGLVPMPFAEGDFSARLDVIKDMPEGKVIWHFETMDMARAKKVLGKNACIAGNVPASLLCTDSLKRLKTIAVCS